MGGESPVNAQKSYSPFRPIAAAKMSEATDLARLLPLDDVAGVALDEGPFPHMVNTLFRLQTL